MLALGRPAPAAISSIVAPWSPRLEKTTSAASRMRCRFACRISACLPALARVIRRLDPPATHPTRRAPARVRSPPAPAAPRSAQLARRADRALQLLEGVLDRPPPGQAAVVLELAELRPAFAGHPLLPHESAGGVDRPAIERHRESGRRPRESAVRGGIGGERGDEDVGDRVVGEVPLV